MGGCPTACGLPMLVNKMSRPWALSCLKENGERLLRYCKRRRVQFSLSHTPARSTYLVSPHDNLTSDSVLHSSHGLTHGCFIPGMIIVFFGLRSTLSDFRILVIIQQEGTVTFIAKFGGENQPGLEFGVGNFVIVCQLVKHFEGTGMDSSSLDIFDEFPDFFTGDVIVMIGVDAPKQIVTSETGTEVGHPASFLP